MEKNVSVLGEEVYYREIGNGFSILIFPGWGGPATDFYNLQEKLAEKGYRVIVPDLPGLGGKTKEKYLQLEDWSAWVDIFVRGVIREKFILVSQSLSARIAIRYLSDHSSLCLDSIILNPGLALYWQARLWRLSGKLVRFFHLYRFFPKGMRWLKNFETYQTAIELFSSIEEQEKGLTLPCVIFRGRRDPINYLLTGWKIINCEKIMFNWNHSPQIRATAQLAEAIDKYIRRRFV